MKKIPDDLRVYETSFVIMPTDANYMYPMVFGGAFFSKMDLAAAVCVSRAIRDSKCDSSVTHKFNGTFSAPAEVGHIIFLRAEITDVGKKSITVRVTAQREYRNSPKRDEVASCDFVFVTRANGNYSQHGLIL